MTDKQRSFIKSLLDRKGYGSKRMSAKFKNLGASMRERSGTVDSWLDGKSSFAASNIIKQLLSE